MTTVVSLFDNHEQAEKAVRMLTEREYPAERISVIMRDPDGENRRVEADEIETDDNDTAEAVTTGIVGGGMLGGLTGLLVGVGALAIPGLGPLIAAGPLAAALGGMGVGAAAGGVAGALAEAGVPHDHAEGYAAGLQRGQVMVAVETEDFRASDVRNIMDNAAGRDLERYLREDPYREEETMRTDYPMPGLEPPSRGSDDINAIRTYSGSSQTFTYTGPTDDDPEAQRRSRPREDKVADYGPDPDVLARPRKTWEQARPHFERYHGSNYSSNPWDAYEHAYRFGYMYAAPALGPEPVWPTAAPPGVDAPSTGVPSPAQPGAGSTQSEELEVMLHRAYTESGREDWDDVRPAIMEGYRYGSGRESMTVHPDDEARAAGERLRQAEHEVAEEERKAGWGVRASWDTSVYYREKSGENKGMRNLDASRGGISTEGVVGRIDAGGPPVPGDVVEHGPEPTAGRPAGAPWGAARTRNDIPLDRDPLHNPGDVMEAAAQGASVADVPTDLGVDDATHRTTTEADRLRAEARQGRRDWGDVAQATSDSADDEHGDEAYRYGYDMAYDNRFRDLEWAASQTDLRQDWDESRGPWDQVIDKIRAGWQRAKAELKRG